jgi:membrane-bound metal-dependent hydrolase YbcI (DUF457 family)
MMAPANIVTSATVAGYILGPNPGLIAFSVLASIVADIDEVNSTIGSKLRFLSAIIHFLFGHRTLTHSLLFLGGTYYLIYLLWPNLALAWLIGYSVHIFLDLLTKGVVLFWPLPKWVRIGRFSTNGITETVLIIVILIINISTAWGKELWSSTGQALISSISSIKLWPF